MYHYTECGLSNVYLVNGRPSLALQEIDGLHSAIGKLLVQKTSALEGVEICFLRKEMNRSQTSLGHLMGVCCKTVWRWEQDSARMQRAQDLALRKLYLEFLDCPCSIRALAAMLAENSANSEPNTIILEKDHGQWRIPGQN